MASTDDTNLDGDFDAPQAETESFDDAEPGGELFEDVVEDQGAKPARAVGTEGDVQLRDSVAGIYEMVKDLEVQLNHMVSINEAAERDLETARRAQREVEHERDEIKRKIEQMEHDAESSAELRQELKHMTRENERLIEQMRANEGMTEKWEKRRDELGAALGRARGERDELRQEVEILEAQLDQVAAYIETLRTEVSRASDIREQQARKLDLLDQRLHVVTEERDALRQELNESRSALEEIKRSIMDANMQSQLSYYEG